MKHLFCIHRGHGAHLSRHWVHAIIAHGKVHVVVATVHSSTGLCGVVRLRLLGVDAERRQAESKRIKRILKKMKNKLK